MITTHLPEMLVNDRATESELLAHQVLENGDIVNGSADSRHGHSDGVDCGFLGRQRMFYPSFAELAVATGAAVIAVGIELRRDGQVTIPFGGPWTYDARARKSIQQAEVLAKLSQLR